MSEIKEFLSGLNLFDITSVKLILALILGGILGLERQRQGRAAGLRTHILVCFASTALISSFSHLPEQYEFIRLQPLRLAAGIMTGMGFIGAGTIMRSHNYVRGLTTSACLWLTAAIGIIIGFGYYSLAIKTCLLSFFVLLLLRKLDNIIRTEQFYILTAVTSGKNGGLDHLKKICAQKGGKIIDVNIKKDKNISEVIYKIQLRFSQSINNDKFTDKILDYSAIKKITLKSS